MTALRARRRPPGLTAERMPAAGADAGFTLVEVCATMALAVLMLVALHGTLRSSVQARKDAERQQRIDAMAADFLMRLREINFGKAGDPAPAAAELDELFDDDTDYGAITLMQLRPEVTFSTAVGGVIGNWRIRVSADLNCDGDTTDAREGRADLLAITILFNEVQQYRTLRSAEPAFCQYDAGAGY